MIRDYKINIIIDETIQNDPPPHKPTTSIMSELLAKHSKSGIGGEISSSLDEEVMKFMHCAHSDDNVLTFWKKNEHVFPRLGKVAKAILAIPITSACSESAFSIAGCLIRSRRASTAPHRVEKILFVHDNYDLFNL